MPHVVVSQNKLIIKKEHMQHNSGVRGQEPKHRLHPLWFILVKQVAHLHRVVKVVGHVAKVSPRQVPRPAEN